MAMDCAHTCDTTSSMVYRIIMRSSTRKPLSGSSRTVFFTNLRYPWQLRAFGSCRAHEIFTALSLRSRPFMMSLPDFWSTRVKRWNARTTLPSVVFMTPYTNTTVHIPRLGVQQRSSVRTLRWHARKHRKQYKIAEHTCGSLPSPIKATNSAQYSLAVSCLLPRC
jgi:hypothetical protein